MPIKCPRGGHHTDRIGDRMNAIQFGDFSLLPPELGWKMSKSLIFVTRASKTKNGLLAASVQFRLFLINLGLQVQTNVSIRSYTWHLRGVAQAHSSILVTDWKKERRRDKEGRRHFLLKALKLVCHFSSDSHTAYADCTQKKHGKQKLKQKKTW